MRSKKVSLLLSLFIVPINGYAKFEAHEWGTFTSLVGSNGVTQNGMYHEDEPLPDFVHGFGELGRTEPTPQPPHPPCRNFKICFNDEFFTNNLITQKMETPVIYFYSDKYQSVDVNVKFPEGFITETYPGPVRTYPTEKNPTILGGGESTFSVEILNTKSSTSIPFVDRQNIYSHARNVNSNVLRSGIEEEKFIFYRGLGKFQPRFNILSSNGNLMLQAGNSRLPAEAFLIDVDDKGHGQLMKIHYPSDNIDLIKQKTISAKQIELLKTHNSSSRFATGEQARGIMADGLIRSGLNRDEAYAMLDTWEHGYLKTPGLRLLYILPQTEVDEILPITFTPQPEKFARVFVGRIEILRDTDEQRIISEIIARKKLFQAESLGRFAEPILHRISEVYETRFDHDPEIAKLIRDLIESAKNGSVSNTSIH